MFAYCNNNPVLYIDGNGQSAEVVVDGGFQEWLREWINGTGQAVAQADGPIPIGDLIFVGGIVVLGAGYLFSEIFSSPEPQVNNNASKQFKKSAGKTNPAAKSIAGSTPASPPDPNGNNNRKFNVNKNESPIWRSFKNVKNSKLKTSGRGANQKFYDWDYTHNDIEVYNCRGEHLGSMNPLTGNMYKPPVPGRFIKIP